MDLEPKELTKIIVNVLEEHKAQDINILEVSELTVLGDYFVLASGTSTTHVKSLADAVEKRLNELEIKRNGVEGRGSASWILMDYGNVIVHVFHKETRAFYNLERLWGDGIQLQPNDL